MIKNLLLKFLRRLGRTNKFHFYCIKIEDIIEKLFFTFNIITIIQNLKRLNKLNTLEDYYDFAVDIFDTHQNKEEILNLLELIETKKTKIICEIGTATGGTNFLLSQFPKSTTTMIGIDLYVRNKFLLKRFNRKNITLHFVDGSSYENRTVEKIKRILNKRFIDVLFIDGDHSYEGVKKDYLIYSQLVKEGGLIVFHDIIPDYYTKFGQKTGSYAGNVPVLWNELKTKFKYKEFINNKDQDGLGIGILYHSKKQQKII